MCWLLPLVGSSTTDDAQSSITLQLQCSSITIYLIIFISLVIINTAISSHEPERESSSIIDNNFCAYATRRKLCEKNRSNNMCVWKQKRGGNVDEEGMCIDKRVEEFFESIKRCRYDTKKLFKAYDMDGSGGISLEELDYALSNVRQYSILQKAFVAADRNEDDELDRFEFRHFAKDTTLDGSIFDCDKETATVFKASKAIVGFEAIEELNSGYTLLSRKYFALTASLLVMLLVRLV